MKHKIVVLFTCLILLIGTLSLSGIGDAKAASFNVTGIYVSSMDKNGVTAGLVTEGTDATSLEYSWYACADNVNWILIQDWTLGNEWVSWLPEVGGDYVLVGKARIPGNDETIQQSSIAITCNPHIKGKCQMPYDGEGGGFLIGVESYENPNQSYKYEMLILDCTLLAEGKDAWIYTTGQVSVAEGNALWTVWQPVYGYYWTLFRVYDENGIMIDQACYGFENTDLAYIQQGDDTISADSPELSGVYFSENEYIIQVPNNGGLTKKFDVYDSDTGKKITGVKFELSDAEMGVVDSDGNVVFSGKKGFTCIYAFAGNYIATAYVYIYNYDYEPVVISNFDLYSGVEFLIYLKTDNQEWNTVALRLVDEEEAKLTTITHQQFADVKYNSDLNAAILPVDGGLLANVSIDKPGKYKIMVYEHAADDYYNFIPIEDSVITLDIKDYDTYYKAWLESVIEEVVTDDMTDLEKMYALSNYVFKNFKYIPNDNGVQLTLASNLGPMWLTKSIQCWDATSITCDFADILGIENRSQYAGYAAHTYTVVTIDGEEYIVDSCPLSYTGQVDLENITYLDFSIY